MDSGIYMIYCVETNKPYIGRAENLDERKSEHFSNLKNGNHPCKEMQQDYDKFGAESFRYSILEKCEVSKLKHLEDYYILAYNAINTGYNKKRGDILSLTESDFENHNDEIVEWNNVVDDFKNTKVNNCSDQFLCLQSYIYRLNQFYHIEKHLSDYLDYILNQGTKFYVYENKLSGKEYTEVSKDNLEYVYEKYFVYILSPKIPDRFKKESEDELVTNLNKVIDIINDLLFDDYKASNLIDKELEKQIILSELPFERLTYFDDIFRISSLIKQCPLKFKDDYKVILNQGINCINNYSKLTLNDILGTNLEEYINTF